MSANINKVTVAGNITKDIEVRYTASGKAVTDVTVAINRRFTVNEEARNETTFVEVSAWGKQAELLGKYLRKGDPIMFEGRLVVDEWDDKKSGEKRRKMKVLATDLHFLSYGKRDEDSAKEKCEPEEMPDELKPEVEDDIPF